MTNIIRDATLDDVPALAWLHVQTFDETHGNGPTFEVRERQWREIVGKADESEFRLVIQNPEGELIGFARGKLHDGGVPGYAGELNKIYLLREYHRQGLGRRLVGEVARRFLSRGVNSMLLFGGADFPSNGFYEHLGAERLITESGDFHGGYGWKNLESLSTACPAD